MTIDHEVIADLCRKHGITRLRVFGSYARGDQTDQSDLDLIVEFDHPVGLIELAHRRRGIETVVACIH